ncbi:hypothetical protein HZC33_01970 [Candidatus Wolfebacteria bacterium]|nr:hypothetical protein [Candidatus Wolfebacteria bacterium]
MAVFFIVHMTIFYIAKCSASKFNFGNILIGGAMSEERVFPLVIYQNTEEYKKLFEEANSKFRNILFKVKAEGFKCTFIGDLRLNKNGQFEFWLNSNMPYIRRCSIDEAIKYAKKHGYFGWWSNYHFELFSLGYGPIVAYAMERLGFRKHKKDSSRWARARKEEKNQAACLKDEAIYLSLSEKEAERLKNLIIFPNNNVGLDKTFSLIVGEGGMIYIALDVNPFGGLSAETMGSWGSLFTRRGHLAKQQDGFSIEAFNIKLDEEKMIYIRCVRLDGSIFECVWPTKIPWQGNNGLYDLVSDLAQKASSNGLVSA